MSGPKLMYITNDPKVIQRINNRLNTIGKENYFSSQIQSINIDIQNEMIWIKNYVNETMNNTSIQQDKVEYLHNSLIKIQNNYLIKLNSILLSNTIISEKSITELNNLIVSRIKELPRVKRELMRDILDKIDSIKKIIQKEEYEKQLKIQKEKIDEYNSQESAAENRSRTVRTKVFASILDDADGEKNIEEIDLPSEDYVLLNTIKEGVTEIREMDILTSEDKKYVKMILEDVDNINKTIHFKVECSKGTYIRTLCEEVAERLGTVGYMKELNRTRVGDFYIENSITIEQLEQSQYQIITIEQFFKDEEFINLTEKGLKLFLNGVQLTYHLVDGIYRIYQDDKFIGIGTIKNELLKRDIII